MRWKSVNYNYLQTHIITNMFKRANSDRFIINRDPLFNFNNCITESPEVSSNDRYDKFLYREMIETSYGSSLDSTIANLINMKNTGCESTMDYERVLNPQAQKILDAPDIKDDFYLNLLDWSSKGVLAIGLAEKVYLYSSKQISELCVQPEQNYICSLAYHPQGSLLSVGLYNGKTQIYDAETQTLVRTIKGHNHRVSSSAFTYGLLYTGSRDTQILGHDIRAHHNVVMKLEGHRGQVCGLKHDACGLASGSNDNTAIVWDINMAKPRYHLHGHKGAVKALSWCPWQRNLLVTGGGATDKTMRMWNIQTGKTVNILNTQSQVCSIVCHPTQPEIISSHGYSQYQLNIWRVDKSQINYLNCQKVAQLKGHTQRVLHMALSPDYSTICTASADQTLRFWKIFEQQKCGYQGKRDNKKTDWQQYSLR